MPRKPNATYYKRGNSPSIYFRYYDDTGRQGEAVRNATQA